MYRYVLIIAIFIAENHMVLGQDYGVNNIPDSLLENANAVIRYHEGFYEVKDIHLASYKEKLVVTIINKVEEDLAYHAIMYDKSRKVKSIEARVYDADGKEIRKVKKSEIDDRSNYGSSLYEDTRFKAIDLRQKQGPYTFEIYYEMDINNLYYAKDWIVQPGEGIAVEKSKYTIKAPENLMPRTKIRNIAINPDVQVSGNTISKTFEFNGLKGIETEPYGKEIEDLTPIIIVSPSKFDFDGYKGDLSDWDSYALWQRELNKGRDIISAKSKAEIDNLIKNLPDDESKAKAIYEYMQNRTRYVSIQLGIGGLQTFPAKTVEDMGYGDCKALSNYTQSLLNYANIKSHYTLVYAGSDPPKIEEDFPYHAFNHVILCVPNAGDTLWLECTSQQNPFGYIGRFTGDRDVLLITENGGEIVHTKSYSKDDNLQLRHGTVDINIEGSGKAEVSTYFKGLQFENRGLHRYVNENHDALKEWTLQNTDIPNFHLLNFDYQVDKKKVPSITQKLNLELKNYAQVSGKRIFLPLNLMNRLDYIPSKNESRQSDVSIKMSYMDTDSLTYTIPEGIHPEYIPKPVEITSRFGRYSSTVSYEDNKVTYVRRMSMNNGVYPKESYSELREFFKKITKADKAKIVFLRST